MKALNHKRYRSVPAAPGSEAVTVSNGSRNVPLTWARLKREVCTLNPRPATRNTQQETPNTKQETPNTKHTTQKSKTEF